MSKRKILTLAMTLAMVAILAIGGTLAYFTDTDTQTNVFTVGNVAIDLFEDFGDLNPLTPETLVPSTMVRDEFGMVPNGVEKEVYVENEGSEEAYVRVHVAIPSILDSGDPEFDAIENVLHWTHAALSTEAGKWSWKSTYTEGNGYDVNDWNYYGVKIGGIDYNVYVATYRTALKKGEQTCDAINQVYLDASVTNEDITKIKQTLGDQWMIKVVAEGAQADGGFDNAYDALNTAFGVPGTYIPAFGDVAQNDHYKDTESIKGYK